MNNVFKTTYTLVTEQNGVITVKSRSKALMIIVALELAAGAFFYFVSGRRISADGSIEQFCFWASVIILPLAAVMAIIGLLNELTSRIVFDCNLRKMRKGFKDYEFSQIKSFGVEKVILANRQVFVLNAQINEKQHRLASETSPETLEKVAVFLKQKLCINEFPLENMSSNAAAASWTGQHFIGIILVSMGIVWAGTGYFFLQNIILTFHRSEKGLLVWPLGLWMLALGLCDLIHIPVFRWMKDGKGWIKGLTLTIFFASYFLICWR